MTGLKSTDKELGYAIKKDDRYLVLTSTGLIYWVANWVHATLFDHKKALRILNYFDEKDTKVEKVQDSA